MRTAFPRSAPRIPVCSKAGFRLAAFPAGRAERSKEAEGKIKETGTMSGRLLKLSLSAHWLGERRAAPCFLTRSAMIVRNALALLSFDRHYRRKTPGFRGFALEARS